MMEMYPYLSANLSAISFPLFRSIEAKIRYAYLLNLIPFSKSNEVLQVGMTPETAGIYKNAQNYGNRIWTIPIEEKTLLLMNVSLSEYFRNRKQFNKPKVISL